MEEASTYCNNCEKHVSGTYCEHCGQRTSISKVSFRETFQDFVDAVFSINAPLFRTTKMLFASPGQLFRDFLGGRRKSYYKPVAFFVLTTILYLIVRSLIGFNPVDSITTVQVQDSSGEHGWTLAREFMFRNINKMLFIFVFTLALFLKLFFAKKNTLAEFVALSFYLAGVYTLFTIVNMFFIQYLSEQIQVGGMVLMWIYFIYAMISFFQDRKWRVGLKSAVLFYLAIFSYVLLAFFLSYAIVSLTQL